MSSPITRTQGTVVDAEIRGLPTDLARSNLDDMIQAVFDAAYGYRDFKHSSRARRAAFAREGLDVIFSVRPDLRGSDGRWRSLERQVNRLSRPSRLEGIKQRWRAFRETPAGRALGWLSVPLLFVLTKLKTVLAVATKLKFFMPLVSMVAAIGAYALFWGIPFAAGVVALLFVHEMGHAIQLRREGIKASAPLFIPFLGAVIKMREMPHDAAMEARVGLAGPVLGTAAAFVPLALYFATGDLFFQALAYVGFFLNLFNLIPLTPLDGGRAMAAVSVWAWPVGLAVLIGLMFLIGITPLLVLIAVIGGFEAYGRLRARKEAREYYTVSPRQRSAVAAVYLALLAITAVGTQLTFIERLPGA